MDNQLYEKLAKVRDELKIKYRANGRTPTICTDEALTELAKKVPKKKDDMINIMGLGKTFVIKYGDYFMATLNEHHKSKIKTKELNNNVRNTLKNLENRLVNISKRNRLLYMGKLYNLYAIDLVFEDEEKKIEELINFVFSKKKSLLLYEHIDGGNKNSPRYDIYKKVSTLLREVSKEFRETGQHDLFIGYPFVIGKLLGEDFNVRAPLVLFPIEIIDDKHAVQIRLDTTKDILFNNNIILLHNKFNKINKDLPNNVLEDCDKETFLQKIKEFYFENGIKIEGEISSLSKFKDLKEKEFPKINNGEYYLSNNIVLGKFPLYSNALQRDFKEIIEAEEINVLLDELLVDIEDIDLYAEEIEEEQVEDIVKQQPAQIDYSEKTINYINDLNFSQEDAIRQVYLNNRLVVQGPPGTGKSQTITSLITDAVVKNKNVLVVSQKKAALDVIYSRLGNLSQYALMITDVKNKNAFYEQLEKLIYSEAQHKYDQHVFNYVANEIDRKVERLDKIAKRMFEESFCGCPLYKVYQENLDNQFKTQDNDSSDCYYNVNFNLLEIKYQDLKLAYNKFKDQAFLDQVLLNHEILNKHNFVKDVKDKLTSFDRNNMLKDFSEFENAQAEYLKYNIFKKLFNFSKRKKQLNELFNKYFKRKDSFKYLYKNPDKIIVGLKEYANYQNTKDIYSQLSNEDIYYIQAIYNLQSQSELSTQQLNKRVYDFIVFSFIDKFESENKLVLNDIKNFDNIIRDISSLAYEKKEITKQRLKNILISHYQEDIATTKRAGEIKRVIESKRKLSVNKFIEKFNFELFKGIKVWLLTPETVSEILPLEEGLFNILVFDEASQIYIEKAVPAISRAQKVVISGDHKQLRPSSLGFGRIDFDDEDLEVDNDHAIAALEEESLLDLARFKFPEVLLNYHYRSKYQELIAFSNYAFYKGRLNVSPNLIKPETPPIEVIKIEDGLWADRKNLPEAKRTVALIKEVLLTRKNKETIGIITFNVGQRDLILDLLDEECLKDSKFANVYKKELDRKDKGEDIGLFVKNIENVQGDERDIIIFSLAYAKNEKGKVAVNFGWLNQRGGENRLNVAISRAKQKIYIVTSINSNELKVEDLKNEGPKIFKKYLEYAQSISVDDVKTAQRILFSFIQNDNSENTLIKKQQTNDFVSLLKADLETLNYIVDCDIGMGEYKIDLCIKDKENKYILGIDCDSKLYETSKYTKERDYYRDKYFESRGWKVIRIFSSDYWSDKEKCLNNIKHLIEKD